MFYPLPVIRSFKEKKNSKNPIVVVVRKLEKKSLHKNGIL